MRRNGVRLILAASAALLTALPFVVSANRGKDRRVDCCASYNPSIADGGDAAVDAGVAADGGDAAADGGDAAVDAGADAGTNGFAIITESTEYLTVADHADFSPVSTMSISMWFRDTGSAGTMPLSQSLISQWGGSDNSWELKTSANGLMSFYIASGATDSANHYDCSGWNRATLYHIVVTYNAGTVVMYQDGSAIAGCSTTGSIPATIRASARNVGIGARVDGTQVLAGDIDEVAFFSTALSVGDVASLRNGTHPANNIGGISGIKSWWQLGDGSDSATSADGFVDRISSHHATGVTMESGDIQATPF